MAKYPDISGQGAVQLSRSLLRDTSNFLQNYVENLSTTQQKMTVGNIDIINATTNVLPAFSIITLAGSITMRNYENATKNISIIKPLQVGIMPEEDTAFAVTLAACAVGEIVPACAYGVTCCLVQSGVNVGDRVDVITGNSQYLVKNDSGCARIIAIGESSDNCVWCDILIGDGGASVGTAEVKLVYIRSLADDGQASVSDIRLTSNPADDPNYTVDEASYNVRYLRGDANV